MKKIILILIFAFFAGSGQAQDACSSGAFCDRDADGFFKNHQRCTACGGTTDCDDSDANLTVFCPEDEQGTSYTVEVMTDTTLDNPVIAENPSCAGSADLPGLDANFPPNCGMITVDDGLELCVFSIHVLDRNKGTQVQLFFSADCGSEHTDKANVYVSELLEATFDEGTLAATFFIKVNAQNQPLTKLHQPDRGTVVGQFSAGTMVYQLN